MELKLLTKSKSVIYNLNNLGIFNSEQLISYLPYRYEYFYYSEEALVKEKERIVVLGRLVSNPKSFSNNKLHIINFHFASNSGIIYNCKAYNRPYLNAMLNLEDNFTLVGLVEKIAGKLIYINVISIKKGEVGKEEAIKPVYHLPKDLAPHVYQNIIEKTFDEYKGQFEDVIPQYLKDKYKLLDREEALRKIHLPKSKEDITKGLRTLKFYECLEYCFKNKLIRRQNEALTKEIDVEIDTSLINEFVKKLPFKPSKDQNNAIREIVLDMKSRSVMYRLLQGDVGTGKTLVAALSLYANYLRNKQGVLLAPTDSLSRQHFESITKFFKDYPVKIELLLGSMTPKEKELIREKLKNHEIDIIIGTHAVFSKNVEYSSLGLAIIDEQHRFGVNQRNSLAFKGDNVDLLLMSATPIPRTLALSIYGDLNVSSLTTYPLGEHQIKTLVVDYDSDKIIKLIDYCLKNHKQVFMVAPRITYSEETISAEEIYGKYKDLYQDKIALLHGKIKVDEREIILSKFRSGEVPLLVATSIIELGIDIKTAGGIIIFSASNFGLASLHQLRGRVGRDSTKAFCLLVDELNDDLKTERLRYLESHSDGFEIAEKDMELRGPGDFIGIDQSGFPSFSALNIVNDFKMFTYARDETTYILNNLNEYDCNRYYQYVSDLLEKENKDLVLQD